MFELLIAKNVHVITKQEKVVEPAVIYQKKVLESANIQTAQYT